MARERSENETKLAQRGKTSSGPSCHTQRSRTRPGLDLQKYPPGSRNRSTIPLSHGEMRRSPFAAVTHGPWPDPVTSRSPRPRSGVSCLVSLIVVKCKNVQVLVNLDDLMSQISFCRRVRFPPLPCSHPRTIQAVSSDIFSRTSPKHSLASNSETDGGKSR